MKESHESTNEITRRIISHINSRPNGFAERILCVGVPIPVGHGLFKLGRTSMHSGTADISGILNSISLKIEVKAGQDKMSSYQKAYANQVNQAGGLYYVARSYEDFLEWFSELEEELNHV